MRYILLIGVGSLWVSQYLLNALLLDMLSPFALSSLRMFIGFIALYLIMLFLPSQDRFTLNLKLFGLLVLTGFFESAFPFYLIAYAQTKITSSLTAIILGTIPIFSILLDTYYSKKHTINMREILAMLLAFFGLVILLNPKVSDFEGPLFGYIAVLLASMSFAYSFVLMQMIPNHISPIRVSRFILGIYSVPMLLIILLQDTKLPLELNIEQGAALLSLGVFSTALAYVLYIKLIRVAGVTFSSLSNYLVPVVGTFLGVYFLDEPLSKNIYYGSALILIGLIALKKRSKE